MCPPAIEDYNKFSAGEDTPPYDTKKEPEGIGFLKSYD